MRLISSGIPAHSYGQGKQQWDHLVTEQLWDITVPLISDEDGIDTLTALQRDVEPTEFLVEAAREGRPIGMALNGVPFFSPLTPTGANKFLIGTGISEGFLPVGHDVPPISSWSWCVMWQRFCNNQNEATT